MAAVDYHHAHNEQRGVHTGPGTLHKSLVAHVAGRQGLFGNYIYSAILGAFYRMSSTALHMESIHLQGGGPIARSVIGLATSVVGLATLHSTKICVRK